VKKYESSGTTTWSLSITSSTCDVPNLQFEIKSSSIVGVLNLAQTTRVQEHSPPMSGSIDVSFKGQGTRFGPYSEASDVQKMMKNLSTVRGARVNRVGNCQAGFSWVISFTDVPGDLPLLNSSSLSLDSNTTLYVETVTDGGLLIAPLPADYFRVPEGTLQVHAWVNGGAAACGAMNGCQFDYSQNLTPVISSAQSQNADGSTMYPTYTISGEKLDSITSNQSETAIVLISQQDCRVYEASANELKCIITGSIPTGMHAVSVNVPGRGWAEGNCTVSYPLSIVSIQPQLVSAVYPTILRVLGFGFNPDSLHSNVMKVLVDSSLSLDCSPLNSSTYELFCVINPANCQENPSRCGARRVLDSSISTISASMRVGDVQFSFKNALRLLPMTPPVVYRVLPSQGSGGGGILITVDGINFSPECADNSVFLGATKCPISSCNQTQICCILSPSVSSVTNVTVYVDGVGISEPSNQSIFEYVFNINDVAPKSVGLGGGAILTVTGEGLKTSNGQIANISLAFPGWEISVVSLYGPKQITEMHKFSLIGDFVNCVQEVTISGELAFFFLELDGKSSALLPRDVNQYVVEAEIQSLLSKGSVRVQRRDLPACSTFILSIEFRGNLGPVSLLIGAGCSFSATQETISSTCNYNDGINSTIISPGLIPTGSFSISMRESLISLQVYLNSSALTLQSEFSVFNIPNGVVVTRADTSKGTDWIITFNSVQEKNYLFAVDSSGVNGGAVSVSRIRDGTLPLSGQWALSLGGVSTHWMFLNATEKDVIDVIQGAIHSWDDVVSVDVTQADDLPGPFLNRDYPRQWAIKLLRQYAIGKGKERCTNPLYVDWDPTACPKSAPDLFLAYFPHHWPSELPKPADLEDDSYTSSWQKSCDLEAVSLNLVPTVCEALRPVETLPYCGVGSGINPPCWITRFSTAKVAHRNGDQVTYNYNNEKSPTESVKGFGFWQQEETPSSLQRKKLSLNYSISIAGAGMNIRSLDPIGGAQSIFNSTPVNSSAVIVFLRPLFQNVLSYLDTLRMDIFFQPMLMWRYGNATYNGLSSGFQSASLAPTDGIMFSGNGSTFSSMTSALVPLNPEAVLSEFTAEFWLRVNVGDLRPSTCSLIIRMIGTNGIVCAFAICRSSSALAPTLRLWTDRSTLGNSGLYSCVEAAFEHSDGWTHVAVSSDGRLQRLYVNGFQVQETVFDTSIQTFKIGLVVLSHACEIVCSNFKTICFFDSACNARALPWLKQIGAGFSVVPYVGDVDWVLVYSVRLSPSTIWTHSQAPKRAYSLAVQASFGQTTSTCEPSKCLVSASFDTTPDILRIEPSSGSPGIQITIFGRNMLGYVRTVRIGTESCTMVATTKSMSVCNISETQALGLMPVSIELETYGKSANFMYSILPYISGVLPLKGGNILGGTNVTIFGSGFAYQDPGKVHVTVGESKCGVISVQSAEIICEVERRGIPNLSPVMLSKVRVSFDSIPAVPQCNSSLTWQNARALQKNPADMYATTLGIIFSKCPRPFFSQQSSTFEYIPSAYDIRQDRSCLFAFSTAALPSVISIFPSRVKQNTVLQIFGSQLFDEVPIIRVGACSCPVINISSTEVSCTVANCEGGKQRVSVQTTAGFALNTQTPDCDTSEIIYIPSITAVVPSTGSVLGDFLVTILGSGFSSNVERNKILIGDLKVEVLQASSGTIIAKVPVNYLGSITRASLEHSVLAFETCAEPSDCNKSDIRGALQTCFPFGDIQTQQNASVKASRILAEPPSIDSNLFLVDSDPKTIWSSKKDSDKVLIGIDLNQVQSLKSIKLFWAENTSPVKYQVIVASSCDGERKVINRSLCWPNADTRNLARSCGNDGESACLATLSQDPYVFKEALAPGGVDGVRKQTPLATAASCVEVFPRYWISGCPTWWRVDFNVSRSVGGGNIWNRWDAWAGKLSGFQVWIGDGADFGSPENKLCFTSSNEPASMFVDPFFIQFQCVGKGRYLFISTPLCDYLAFCEVEVFDGAPECSVPVWNQVDEISFDPGTQAKFVSLQLLQRRRGATEYKLRGIEIAGASTTQTQPVYVFVNSVLASCEGTPCNISLVNLTEIHSIYPLSGVTGQQITIYGSGFEPTCSDNKLMIGESLCQSMSCSDTALLCRVPELDPGIYSVYLNTTIGRAWGLLSFSSYLDIDNFTPTVSGLGGESLLLIQGNSMACLRCDGHASVSLCGVPARLQLVNRSSLSAVIPAVTDLPAASWKPTSLTSASEDALEYSVPFCYNYSVVNNIRYCYCEAAHWMCFRARYFPTWTSASVTDMVYQYQYLYGNTIWPCSCTGKMGTVISDSNTLGFDLVQGASIYSSWSPQTVYLRFKGLDIPFNSTVLSARLRVFPSATTCSASSSIRIWAESATDSPPFRPYKQGALSARNRTLNYVDWNVGAGWKWAYIQVESVDISRVLNEVFQNKGWRSGNSLTLILRQQVTVGGGACQFLASESGTNYTPSLQVTLMNSPNQTTPKNENVTCDLKLDVALSPAANASDQSLGSCDDALFVTDSRKFPTASSNARYTGSLSMVPGVACCSSVGHTALLALDSDYSTFWRSPTGYSANFTVDLGESGAVVSRLRISWTSEFAANYTVSAWIGGPSWVKIYEMVNGDGDLDEFDVETEFPRRRVSSLRIQMMSNGPDTSNVAFEIIELLVFGCDQLNGGTSATKTKPKAVQLVRSLSPSISGLSPSRGSTAGGGLVNITGSFGTQLKSQLSVDFGGLPCSIRFIQSVDASAQTIGCTPTASGVLNGGLKYVRVVSALSGASVLSARFVYYIDVWSARTTWGGMAPPTGCGDYVVDPSCDESVVIPAGQVVLLDVSPPRFYLILIQGTLIFDRKDLHLKVL
jgi:hypothetical protein